MKGFYLNQKNSHIEKIEKKSSELSLLAKGEGSEVMLMKIQPQKTVIISPSDNPEAMEFVYVLKGSLLWGENNENIIIKEGDYFYTSQLEESVYLETLDNIELLYISTQPIFHYSSNLIKELTGIVEKVEKKDPYTHNHGRRVREYSVKIAKRLDISNERLKLLYYASLFHDIGKINVPDEILNKPGKLTNGEFEYIKQHPVDGNKLVKETSLKGIGQAIEQHHEKLDGSGYPYGLKGEDICLEAKIIAVADIYDAMTSDRPYRKGLTPNIAVDEIKKYSGIHYDSRIVDIFIGILLEEGKI